MVEWEVAPLSPLLPPTMTKSAHPLAHEKRRFQRVRPAPSAPIEVQVMGGAFLEVLHAQDISVGGMAVLVPHGFSDDELSETVQLIISMPAARSFKATARIRHIERTGSGGKFGIEFAELDAAHRAHIARYVDWMVLRGRGV